MTDTDVPQESSPEGGNQADRTSGGEDQVDVNTNAPDTDADADAERNRGA